MLWKTIPVTLPEIKRIEVVKGPTEPLYGFNAFDGVINIITKSPEEMKDATLQFGGGEFGTITSAAVYGGTVGKLGYRLSAGRDQTNQWRSRDSLAFRQHKFNLQTEYPLPGNGRLLVSGGLSDVNRYDGPIVVVVTVSQKPGQAYANVEYQRPNFFIRSWWTELTQPSFIATNPLIAPFFRTTDRDFSQDQSLTWNSYNLEAQHATEFGTVNRLT